MPRPPIRICRGSRRVKAGIPLETVCGRYRLVTICIGGGQGIAALLEPA